jgi:hypothetical protein
VKGQNLVTPQDLGKRVSFQFELPNGYVGEAVGMLERYDHEAATYVVRRKDDTGRVRRAARRDPNARGPIRAPSGGDPAGRAPRGFRDRPEVRGGRSRHRDRPGR